MQEAELSLLLRLRDAECNILVVQNNLATTYGKLGRHHESLHMYRDVYFGHLKAFGEESERTLTAASNYAISLGDRQRYAESKAVSRKTMPVAQRFLGDSHIITLKMRGLYATTLYKDAGATLDDLREAVRTLEETERTARRVFGGAPPFAEEMGLTLRTVRAALAAHETPSLGHS